MEKQYSTGFTLSPETEHIIPKAREEQYLLTSIDLKYIHKTKRLQIGGTGTGEMKSLAVTPAYYDMLENQLENLKKIITPAVKKLKSNFVMTVHINQQGVFDLEYLDTRITLNFPKYTSTDSLNSIFKDCFRVIRPFALYTNSLSVRGHQYRLAVIEADLTLSLEDFLEVIAEPLISPRTEQQWLSFATKVFREGRKQYQLNVTLPCLDGELVWDIKEKQIYLQHQEKF